MESTKILEDFHTRRNSGNKKISSKQFLPFNRFIALDSRAYGEGEIPEKYKELMGLVGSMVLRCNDCIYYHIDSAFKAGCSEKEILEAMNIALVIGGSVVIPVLRAGLTALDEIISVDNGV